IARAWWCLHVQLRGRRAADGPIARLLAGLLARTRRQRTVQLSISPTIAVPLATGIVRPEIVVPERALGSLAPAAQESMLAHELAHVLRRDPAWRLALLVLERVFFFQPLLRLARRRIAQHAEYLSDAWAVDNTSQPLELARCLTEIAGWVQQRTPVLAAGMAEPRSILGRRVLRLVAPQREPTRMRALPWLAIAGLFATVMVAPAIGSAHERAHVMQHAAGTGAPMIVVVHEDGRAAGELETSPPGLPARAAVVVASNDPPKGDRKAQRKAAKQRRATEKELRKTIRAAKKQHRLPTAEELARVLGEGHTRGGRPVAGLRVERNGEAMVIVLDPEAIEDLSELGDIDIDIDIDDEAIEAAIAQAHRARQHGNAERARAVAAAKRAAKAHAKMHGKHADLERRQAELERRIEREVARELDRARAQSDEQRRAAEHIREHADEIRQRAMEEYMRAWQDAAPRGPAPRGRRRVQPRQDIVPILAPVPATPPSPPTAALAPLPPMAPSAPALPPAPPAFAPPAPPHAPMLAPSAPPAAPMLAPPAPPAPRKRARPRHAPPPGITFVVAPA
ncbi:MAG TPA: M56 family metallopeptidase, partial [Nannocystaceae bacterium]|nr:M56 family metallopeptidase [Nannocystaceae bacterium]